MILMNTEKLGNKKEKIRLTVALKKRKPFFLYLLMLSVWQWLSFVKEQCCALFQQLHDNDEKKYFSSSNDGPSKQLSLGQWESTFQINNRLAKMLIHHVPSYTLSVCLYWANIFRESLNKSPSVYQMHREVFLAFYPLQEEVFCTCFEWILYSSLTKSLKYKKGPFH